VFIDMMTTLCSLHNNIVGRHYYRTFILIDYDAKSRLIVD